MAKVLTNFKDFETTDKINYLYHIILYIFAFSDLYISIGTINVKLFYIISIPCCIVSLANTVKNKLSNIEILFLMWIFCSLFALNVTLSVNDVIVCIIGECVLFLLYKDVLLFCDKFNISINKAVDFISNIILICCLWGLCQYFLYKLLGINVGISHTNMFPRPRSIFLEADWLGLYSCIGSFVFLVKIIFKYRRLMFNYFGFFICFVVMLLSFTRAAWVSFAFSVLIAMILLKGNKKFRLCELFFGGIFFAVILLFILSLSESSYSQNFIARLNPFKWQSHDGGATDTRTYSIEIMWYYIKIHPIFGNGSGSMNYISSNTDILNSLGYFYEINAGRGNANVILATLFDIGIIGFLVFFRLIMALYKNIIHLNNSKTLDSKFMGIICSGIFWIFMIDFQFNNGIRFASVWMFFSLCVYFSRKSTTDLHATNRCVNGKKLGLN